MQPTPTAPGRILRPADVATLAEALDVASQSPTGINVHSLRGQLVEVLPYAALREQALAVASRLLAAGLEPGDRVLIAAESDGDFLRAFFGCQYAGLVPAPAPLPAPLGGRAPYVEHVRRMLISCGARAAIAPPAIADWFAEASEGLDLVASGDLATLPDAGPERLPAPDPNGLCYLQFSSGSTRFPTGVSVTQRALIANLQAIGRDGLAITAEDRAVSWLPLYHDMGLVGMLLSALGFQCSLDLLPTGAFVRRPGLWVDMISRHRATISYAPTFGYELAARRVGAAPEGLDLSSWRVAGLGGDMIRPEGLHAFAAAYKQFGFDSTAYTASYGMAEATLALSMSPAGDGLRTDVIDVDQLEARARAEAPNGETRRVREFALCGRPLAGHRLEVRGESGEALGERQVGRVFAWGPSLMKAYFNAPEETARVLSPDGWLDTGDLGYRFDHQIVITGRAKDLIIVNGRNVWPQDLEWTAEREIDALRSGDVAVISLSDADQERVIALVQCRTSDLDARAALEGEVERLLRSRHGLEIQVVLTPPHSLPQTSSGKLSRTRAKAMYLAGAFARAPVEA
ncbi:MAG TPA: fatty acyl-AMP ligase [Caulobacteraceae bacterium]|nr:fatty acyl-AMP ligase [Caulobacteraceae bacterium]